MEKCCVRPWAYRGSAAIIASMATRWLWNNVVRHGSLKRPKAIGIS